MSFVKAPVSLNRNPHQVHFIQLDPERAYRPLQYRGKGYVETESLLFHQPARLCGLLYPLIGKVDVGPAGKEVFLVPDTLSVPKQDDG